MEDQVSVVQHLEVDLPVRVRCLPYKHATDLVLFEKVVLGLYLEGTVILNVQDKGGELLGDPPGAGTVQNLCVDYAFKIFGELSVDDAVCTFGDDKFVAL